MITSCICFLDKPINLWFHPHEITISYHSHKRSKQRCACNWSRSRKSRRMVSSRQLASTNLADSIIATGEKHRLSAFTNGFSHEKYMVGFLVNVPSNQSNWSLFGGNGNRKPVFFEPMLLSWFGSECSKALENCKVNSHKDFIHYIWMRMTMLMISIDILKFPQDIYIYIWYHYWVSTITTSYPTLLGCPVWHDPCTDPCQIPVLGLISIIHPASRKLKGNAPLEWSVYMYTYI